MNETQTKHDAAVAVIDAETAVPKIRVVVNRLPGTKGWRPGVAPTLEVVIEAE
jgi:hypothetical protein